MALIADSGGIYGLYDASEKKHKAIRAGFEAERGVVVIPMPVLSEIDYLLRKKLGIRAELDFIDDVCAGAFALEPCSPEDLQRSRSLIETYRDLDLGLADACVIACAERLGTRRVLTVDERHFRVVRTGRGQPLILIPADA
jgi:predicted nucleic acid-binding protein